MFAACGSSKQVANTNTTTTKQATVKSDNTANQALSYVRKVNDNAVYANNIVSKIDFTLNAMGKDISVSGKLYMRKNEVVRKVFTSNYHPTREIDVELFTWEKLDRVDDIRKAFNL